MNIAFNALSWFNVKFYKAAGLKWIKGFITWATHVYKNHIKTRPKIRHTNAINQV